MTLVRSASVRLWLSFLRASTRVTGMRRPIVPLAMRAAFSGSIRSERASGIPSSKWSTSLSSTTRLSASLRISGTP